MKKIFALIGLLMLVGFARLDTQNDPKAEQLLDKVARKFASYRSVAVEFTYELYNSDAQVRQETNGRVTIAGNKYRAEYMGITDIYDGQKRYVIVPETQEVNVSTPKAGGEAELTPATLFSFFKKGYRMKWDIRQPVQGRWIQYVKLIPVKEDDNVKYVLLGIDTKTDNIYKAIIRQNDGTVITILIRKFDVNVPVSDGMFRFDRSKYQDYYFNDLD